MPTESQGNTMNRLILAPIALAAAIFAAPSFADDITPEPAYSEAA